MGVMPASGAFVGTVPAGRTSIGATLTGTASAHRWLSLQVILATTTALVCDLAAPIGGLAVGDRSCRELGHGWPPLLAAARSDMANYALTAFNNKILGWKSIISKIRCRARGLANVSKDGLHAMSSSIGPEGSRAWMAVEGAVALGMAGRGVTLVLHISWFNCSSWIRAKEITAIGVYGCRAFTSPWISDFRPLIKVSGMGILEKGVAGWKVNWFG
ncbi:hypothetical protein GW17_00025771 [Ensete ventricosum]|nr:hypothetical protein GW17_00025771 [Ensete ventricosum]